MIRGYDCAACGHPRASHKCIGDGGCQECHCPIYQAEGLAWAIQAYTRWMQFSRPGEPEHCWPCTNLADARMFSDVRIADEYVRRHHEESHAWVVRELLATPLDEDQQKGLEG